MVYSIMQERLDVFPFQEIEFQPLSWSYYNADVEKHEERASDSEEEFQYTIQTEFQLVIQCVGVTEDGKSVYGEFVGFRPYILFFPEEQENLVHAKMALECYMKRQDRYNIVYPFSFVYMRKFYGYDEREYAFLKVECKNSFVLSKIKKWIGKESEERYGLHFLVTRIQGKKFFIYESDVDILQRFYDIADIPSCGWLRVSNASTQQVCNYNFRMDYRKIQKVQKDTIAPFRIASFDIECMGSKAEDGYRFPDPEVNPVIQIGMTIQEFHTSYEYQYIGVLGECEPIPNVQVEEYETEEELLEGFVKVVRKMDPDILIGYNIFGFDWKYLYKRAKQLQVTLMMDRRIPRNFKVPGQSDMIEKQLKSSALGENYLFYPDFVGRVSIDFLKVVRTEEKLESYKLDNVAKALINMQKHDLPPQEIFRYYEIGTKEKLKVIAEYCLQDCKLVSYLMDKKNTIVNNIGMANVCGVNFQDLFLSGQTTKANSILSKYCRRKNFATPTLKREIITEDDPPYQGAYVLDPEVNFYTDPIVILDFASLYPTSMIECNISPETYLTFDEFTRKVREGRIFDNESHQERGEGFPLYNIISFDKFEMKRRENSRSTKKVKYVSGIKQCVYVEKEEKGVAPTLLIELLQQRKKIKRMMKEEQNSFRKRIYDGLQNAYKITANSVYGYFGSKFGKMRFQDIAASTTAVGRKRILLAKETAEKLFRVKVIYGDTDSIFVNIKEEIENAPLETYIPKCIQFGQHIGKEINKVFRKPQDLEYEKLFYMFLLMAKKRYVYNLYSLDEKNHTLKVSFGYMGIALKRRDYCLMIKEIMEGVITRLFNVHKTREENIKDMISYYREMLTRIFSGQEPMHKFILSKTLKTNYKSSEMVHKILVEKMRFRDPGSVPQSNERVPYLLLNPKYIQCLLCNSPIDESYCKCKYCLLIYCKPHMKEHNCNTRCRFCYKFGAPILCEECDSYYCKKCMRHTCKKSKSTLLQGDMAEEPRYVTDPKHLHYMYYYEHQIEKPMNQIFQLIEEIRGKKILQDILCKYNNKQQNMKSIIEYMEKKI